MRGLYNYIPENRVSRYYYYCYYYYYYYYTYVSSENEALSLTECIDSHTDSKEERFKKEGVFL
jgi:hypothetical protein